MEKKVQGPCRNGQFENGLKSNGLWDVFRRFWKLWKELFWKLWKGNGQFENDLKSNGLWCVFSKFWKACVAMFLQRPKLRFDLPGSAGTYPQEFYSPKRHQLLDDSCRSGHPVITIIPAVQQDSDSSPGGRPILLVPARVLPQVEHGERKMWMGHPHHSKSTDIGIKQSGEANAPASRETQRQAAWFGTIMWAATMGQAL